MAPVAGTLDEAAQKLHLTLEAFRLEGLAANPDDPVALKYEGVIDDLARAGLGKEAWQALADDFRQTFGYDKREIAAEGAGRREPFENVLPEGSWFKKFIQYTSQAKTTPQLFYGAALAFISAGFGRAPLIEWQANQVYPNNFILLVGGTGAGKGTAIGHARRIVGPAMGPFLLPTEGTHQGYAEKLRRRYDETGLTADGLIVSPELKVLLAETKHKAEIVTWLTDWYDSPDRWDRALRAGEEEYVIDNMCVSLLGASNMVWLRRVQQDAILGGFFPRFLVFTTREHEEKWGVSDPQFDEGLKAELQLQLQAAMPPPQHLAVRPAAKEWIEEWFQGPHKNNTESCTDERHKGWLIRKQVHLYKTAMVTHLVEHHEGGLCVPCVRTARDVLDWVESDVKLLYHKLGTTEEREILDEVLTLVQRRGGEESEKKIKRLLRNRYSSKAVAAAIEELILGGDLQRGQAKVGMGGAVVRVV